MRLDELQKGDMAIIKEIDADPILKRRFYSFGLMKGVSIVVKEYSIKKKTIEIEVNRARVALRIDEAKKIEVEHQCKI